MGSIGFGGSLPAGYVFLLFFLVLIIVSGLCSSAPTSDTLTQNDTLTGKQTLVSSGNMFEFGFFDPGNSTGRYYLGIWYHDILPRTVVWVANRATPFANSSGLVRFRSGNLVVDGVNPSSNWWSMCNSSNELSNNLTAQIKDNGNLVVSQQGGIDIWESFDFPTDTFLPKQKLIVGGSNNELTILRPWKSDVDPSPGNFSLFLDPRRLFYYYQLLIVDNPNTQMSANSTSIGAGDVIWWRSGPWSEAIGAFNGITETSFNSIYGYSLTPNDNGAQFSITMPPNYDGQRIRFVLLRNGTLTTNIYYQKHWTNTWSQPFHRCDFYNHCGKNALCVQGNDPLCHCLSGFKPSLASEWGKGNWSGGCIRKTTIAECQFSDVGFMNLTHVKTPDLETFYRPREEARLNESNCRDFCLNNCTCTAYVFLNRDGCYTWSGDLLDLQNLTKVSMGASLSIKLNASDLPQLRPPLSGDDDKEKVLVIVLPVFGVTIFAVFSIFLWTKYKSKFKEVGKKMKSPLLIISRVISGDQILSSNRSVVAVQDELSGEQQSTTELPLLDFEFIKTATNDFNKSNTLGKGGFGHVYKGVLPGGEEVAVKRLAKNSCQGFEEFKNEMILIARLQHNNLVRMQGVCIQGDEKILVYEYMPNKSLDDFIFNPAKQHMLDWKTRFGIIEGIARGLLYLHRDSRLRIVHRDLKASNVLLDQEMNPKISDFGMARIFGGNQNDQDKTTRVVGTFGYMSPEYAIKGMFSVKSDVYSFGVMILEIICGVKNNRFGTHDHPYLLGYAWQLWNEDRGMELVDQSIKSTCSTEDVLRCEHVALLCVQDRPIDRPTMSDVVFMLGTESSIQQIPKKPAFTVGNRPEDIAAVSLTHYTQQEIFSENELTVTGLTIR